MKGIKTCILILFCLIITILSGTSFAQDKTIAQLQTELMSPWLVTVDGEHRTRTLKIKSVSQKTADSFHLDAEYGFSDGKLNAVQAEIGQIAQERKLNLITQSDTKIVATQEADGNFSGTFTSKNGVVKNVKITKLSPTELQALQDSAKAEWAIVKPGADVPTSCATFSGVWAGNWTQGGIGKSTLRVTRLDAKCMATIKYDSSPPENVEIKDGLLEWICNKSTNGTCVMRRKGDDITANYSNPAGGSNFAYFEKIK